MPLFIGHLLVSGNALGANFRPGFPILGLGPFSPAIINSVSDRTISSGSYVRDNFVRAYSGEVGAKSFGASGDCYKKDLAGTSFILSGSNYRGAVGTSFLCYDGHPGVDFKADGATVVSVEAGVVKTVVNDRSDNPDLNCGCFGNYLTIDHENGYVSIYAHLRKGTITKVPGNRVVRGATIGISGNSGASTGPHLHFELRKTSIGNTIVVDPYTLWYPQYTFRIDSLKIQRNGSLYFEDSFNNGVPPPSAPNLANGTPISYAVQGSVGPEGNGKLTLDSSTAEFQILSSGRFQLFQQARLLTDTDSANLASGLKIDDIFSVTGIFDLVLPNPSTIIEEYGIGLSDRLGTSEGNDDVRMLIRKGGSGTRISFTHTDFSTDTTTIITSVSIDPNHQQIALTLSRPSLANNRIVASYAYVDNGVMGPGVDLIFTADIFRGESFTRPRIIAFTQFN